MFDREEHRKAAQAVCAVLAKHQRAFQELVDFEGSASDQTFAVLHAQAYAELFLDIGMIPNDQVVRHVLEHSGIFQATDMPLTSLGVVVAPLLFVRPSRKPIRRTPSTKNAGTATSPVQENESGAEVVG